MKKELGISILSVIGLLSLTGCGSQIDNQKLSNNDCIWTVKDDKSTGYQFNKNGTGKTINLYSGKKDAGFTYTVENNDDLYKIYLTFDPASTLEIKIPSDGIEKKQLKGKVKHPDSSDKEKIVLIHHDKDYIQEFQSKELESDKKEAKAMMKDASLEAIGTNHHGHISYDIDSDIFSTDDIHIKNNGDLSSDEKTKVTIKSPNLDKTVYESTIKVPKLLSDDPNKIENMKIAKSVLNDMMKEKVANLVGDTVEENSSTYQHEEKTDYRTYYNTVEGTLLEIYRIQSRSRYRMDEEEDWEDWEDWQSVYYVMNTPQLESDNGRINVSHLKDEDIECQAVGNTYYSEDDEEDKMVDSFDTAFDSVFINAYDDSTYGDASDYTEVK